jgi:ATP-dependent protease HslVU (ClpYQ) peptidase subunit
MTCIATDGKTMAGDGLSCSGDIIVARDVRKIRRLANGTLVGVAGERISCQMMLDWFEAGEDLDKLPKLLATEGSGEGKSVVDVLIVRPNGKCEFMDERGVAVSRPLPMAIGSGMEIALGLMLAGKSPRQAVREVARHVASVGGKIVSLKRA